MSSCPFERVGLFERSGIVQRRHGTENPPAGGVVDSSAGGSFCLWTCAERGEVGAPCRPVLLSWLDCLNDRGSFKDVMERKTRQWGELWLLCWRGLWLLDCAEREDWCSLSSCPFELVGLFERAGIVQRRHDELPPAAKGAALGSCEGFSTLSTPVTRWGCAPSV